MDKPIDAEILGQLDKLLVDVVWKLRGNHQNVGMQVRQKDLEYAGFAVEMNIQGVLLGFLGWEQIFEVFVIDGHEFKAAIEVVLVVEDDMVVHLPVVFDLHQVGVELSILELYTEWLLLVLSDRVGSFLYETLNDLVGFGWVLGRTPAHQLQVGLLERDLSESYVQWGESLLQYLPWIELVYRLQEGDHFPLMFEILANQHAVNAKRVEVGIQQVLLSWLNQSLHSWFQGIGFAFWLKEVDIEEIVVVVSIKTSKHDQTTAYESPTVSSSGCWLVAGQNFSDYSSLYVNCQ